MPRFIFRLEPLLEHRRQAERDCQRRAGEIQQKLSAILARAQQAQQTIVEQNRQLARERLVGTLDLSYIAHEKRYVNTLQLLIAQALQEAAQVQQALAAAKAELLVATKARKAIEKVRERQYQRWLAEENRKEAAALDEIGTQLALRHANEHAHS